MYATNYFENMILNLFRGVSAAAPPAVYVGLYLNNPGETGNGVEVVYTGYTRKPITFSTPAAMNGGIGVTNIGDITFPKSEVALGNIPYIGIHDSLTAGNMLLYGELTEVITIDANEAPVIVNGEASWWSIGNMHNYFKSKVFNLLRGQSIGGFTPHLALFRGNPEQSGNELSGSGYARVPITFGAPTELASGQLKITNSVDVIFNRALAPWGMWDYTAVMDSPTGGSAVYGIDRTPKNVRKGLRVITNAGDFGLTVN